MRNIKLTIEYDGTRFAGWQAQQNSRKPLAVSRKKKTVQGTIEKTLKKLFKENIRLIGSGRTDAGVHAAGQVANFSIKHNIALCNLQKALNSILPKDIVITKTEEVRKNFHSRFDARSKVYRYTILNSPHPSALFRDKVYFYPYHLNINLMRREARCLLGRHDFKSFCTQASKATDTMRAIKRIEVARRTYDLKLTTINFIIEANGFLYNMARNIIGTLIEVGRGKLPAGSAKKILQARNRVKAGPTAPAKGLCLVEVKY